LLVQLHHVQICVITTQGLKYLYLRCITHKWVYLVNNYLISVLLSGNNNKNLLKTYGNTVVMCVGHDTSGIDKIHQRNNEINLLENGYLSYFTRKYIKSNVCIFMDIIRQ